MPSTLLDFQQAKANHLLFKSRLRALLFGETPDDETTLISQYACAIGRWIYSHALIAYETIPEVQTLEVVHAAIHTTARELIARYRAGQVQEARRGLVRMEQVADELVQLLDVVEEKVTAANLASPALLVGQPDTQHIGRLTDLLEKNQRLDARLRSQSLELAEKDQIFTTIMSVSPVALWMSDTAGAITYVNQTWIEWTGKSFETHLGTGWTETIIEADRSRAAEQFLADVLAQRPYMADFKIRRQDGAIRWCTVSGQPWYTSQGVFMGYAGSCMDVTERRLAEQALYEKTEQERRILHDFFMQAPAAHCILRGPKHIFELVNPGYKELVGDRDLLGKSVREALPELEGQEFFELLDRVYITREAFIGREVRIVLEKGQGVRTDAYLNFIYQPIVNRQNETDGILVFAYEVTEQVIARRRIEESEVRYRQLSEELDERVRQRTGELSASNRDLLRSNQNLEQFAYIASHDLQEPLRKIQQFGDLLQLQYAVELGDGIDYLVRMQSAASRMSVLIKDLLTYSRISTRQESAALVSLTQVVDQALDNLSVAVKETNAYIQVDALPTVQGDALQLGQLFQNLLSNALKFRRNDPSGIPVPSQIQIHCRDIGAADLPTGIRPGRSVVVYHRIEVTDNGIGFDEKYLDRIFQVFQRLHGKKEFTGTGIGLAICEKVVINHGGIITAISQLGQGTTFIIYLPRQDLQTN